MFFIPKDRLIENLKVIRRSVCAYTASEDRCDCKYIPDGGTLSNYGGEVTGCPEIRSAIEILQKMSDAEYSKQSIIR